MVSMTMDMMNKLEEIKKNGIIRDYVKSHILKLYENCKVIKSDTEAPSGDCINVSMLQPINIDNLDPCFSNLAGAIAHQNKFVKDVIKLDSENLFAIYVYTN